MSEDTPRPRGAGTLATEYDARAREERLELARIAADERRRAAEADAARDHATLLAMQRLVIALVVVLAVLVAGVVAVGVGVDVPGVGRIDLSPRGAP